MQTIRQPAPKPKRTRSDWDEMIRQREALNEQRKQLDRQADGLSKQVAAIDDELVAFVEAETAGEKEKQLTLKSFILSIVWKKPAAMQVAFKAYGKLSKEDKADLAAECGDKKKLEIHWREAPPTAAAA